MDWKTGGIARWTRLALFGLVTALFIGCQPAGKLLETARVSPTPEPSQTITPTIASTATRRVSSTYTSVISPTITKTFGQTNTLVITTASPTIETKTETIPIFNPPYEFHLSEDYLLDYLNTYGVTPVAKYFMTNYPDSFTEEDITNDGVPELILTLGWPGIFIFGRQNEKYVTRFLLPVDGGTIPGRVIEIKDFNHDGIPEILALTGINTHVAYYRVVGWDGSEFRNLINAPSDYLMTETPGSLTTSHCGNVHFTDINKDGIDELLLFNPALTQKCTLGIDPYALPYRDITEIYQWDGMNYSRTLMEYSYPTYRFQAVQDGDRYTRLGEYEKALSSYFSAINNSKLDWWTSERQTYFANIFNRVIEPNMNIPTIDKNESPNLIAYSYYRIMLIYIKQGKMNDAKGIVDLLRSAYPLGKAGNIYTILASTFWDEYFTSKDFVSACQSAISFTNNHREEILVYLGNTRCSNMNCVFHGYQSLNYEPEDVCPVK